MEEKEKNIENNNVTENDNTKKPKNKKIITIIFAILAFAIGLLVGFGIRKIFSNSNSNSQKEETKQNNEISENLDNNEDTKEESDLFDEPKENPITTEENIKFLNLNVVYVNDTNGTYNIKLAKNSKSLYALYDEDNGKYITDFIYRDGPYSHDGRESIYDVVEKAAKASVIKVNNTDYIYIYVVASGFEDAVGYFVIYNPSNGKTISGNTYAIWYDSPYEKYKEGYYYKDGQFAVMLNLGQPEISEGWYFNTSRTGKPEDIIIFSNNGEFKKEKASDAIHNSDNTFTLYTMGSESEFKNANYSNFRADVFDINGKVIKKYINVVSYVSDYVLVLEGNDLVLYNINGDKNIIEKNASKDYIYEPEMRIENDTLKIYRQNKNNYDAWGSSEEITFEIKK